MSGGFPILGDLCNGNALAVAVSVAPSATINTKGSWVQLTSSAPSDISRLVLFCYLFNGAGSGEVLYFDIGVGASGSEVVKASNIPFTIYGEFSQLVQNMELPLAIPAGTRIAIRCANNYASGDTPSVGLVSFDGGFEQSEGGAGAESLGFSSGHGTPVTSGNGTAGSYAQIISATARDYIGVIITMDVGSVASPGTTQWLIDIAIGASGSEKVVIPSLYFMNYQSPCISPFLPIKIPAGTRIAARGLADGSIQNVTVIGVF